jgi:quinol-cytochrome oxidoreductase complex cytochrome b subunit
MFYNPEPLSAFRSIMDINNEIYYGWFLRALHANGASFFFLVVYMHMARGFYYGSYVYPRHLLWMSGILIWILMIVTAFLGYVLPWGQMSFWGAMVITSLLASIPFIGNDILLLLWGGFSIDYVTLQRFYSLHFFLPFLILFISIIHLVFLHEFGSNNLLGLSSSSDSVPFSPFYLLKDFFSVILLFFIFSFFLFHSPDLLGHSDNYQLANFLVTPAHIVPEWYFLPLYAVLRSVTDKLLGIFLLLLIVLTIFSFPYILGKSYIRSSFFRPFYTLIYWFFIINWVILCWLGSLPVMEPYTSLGSFLTFFFFILIFSAKFLVNLDFFLYTCFFYEIFRGKDWCRKKRRFFIWF